jgi:hypothetical protein
MLAGAVGAALATGAATRPQSASAASAPAADPYPLPLPHQIEAEQVVDYLRNTAWSSGQNTYLTADDQTGTKVTWGAPGHPEQFTVAAECASFQTLVLERAYGAGTAYGWATPDYFRQYFFSAEGLSDPGKAYPDAAEFEAGFAAAADIPKFTAVTKPVNLRAGDLVAIDYGDPTGDYSGHIVMIRKPKGTFAGVVDAKLGSDVVPYIFEVIDCTSTAHGDPVNGNLTNYLAFPDTRWDLTVTDGAVVDSAHYTGAGYGHMIFYADGTTGLFAGHRWSVNDSAVYSVAQQPMSAARAYLS